MSQRITKTRKRAPGPGRPPKGEFIGMTGVLSLRMPAEMRSRLAEVATRSNRSLTQEVVRRLEDSLAPPLHIQALSKMVAEIAERVERSTQKHWVKDPFTSHALATAIQGFSYWVRSWQLPPDKTDAVPDVLEARAKFAESAHPGSNAGEQYRTAWGVGNSVLDAVRLQLETFEAQPEASLRDALGIKHWKLNRLAGGGWPVLRKPTGQRQARAAKRKVASRTPD